MAWSISTPTNQQSRRIDQRRADAWVNVLAPLEHDLGRPGGDRGDPESRDTGGRRPARGGGSLRARRGGQRPGRKQDGLRRQHARGNGQMVAFLADSRAQVDAAYAIALAHGGDRVSWQRAGIGTLLGGVFCTMARFVVVSPPMKSATPTTPSLPTTAISAAAPSAST